MCSYLQIPYELVHITNEFCTSPKEVLSDATEVFLKGKALGGLHNIEAIERASFHRISADQILQSGEFLSLTAIALGRLESNDLSFLSSFPRLEHLMIYDSPKVQSLSGIEKLDALKTLWIWDLRGISSLEPLRTLATLENLQLDGSGRSKTTNLESINPVEKLTSLRRLHIGNIKLVEEDFYPLFSLVNLESLCVAFAFKQESMATIAAAHPSLISWGDGTTSNGGCWKCDNEAFVLAYKNSKTICTVCDGVEEIVKYRARFSMLVKKTCNQAEAKGYIVGRSVDREG